MTGKPEYRILIRAYDLNTDVTIALEDSPIFENMDDLQAALHRVLEAQGRKREMFEETYYPTDNTTQHEEDETTQP